MGDAAPRASLGWLIRTRILETFVRAHDLPQGSAVRIPYPYNTIIPIVSSTFTFARKLVVNIRYQTIPFKTDLNNKHGIRVSNDHKHLIPKYMLKSLQSQFN